MECSIYNTARLKLFSNLENFTTFHNLSDPYSKFIFLMSCNFGDQEVGKFVINFVQEIWDKRKQKR